MPTLVPVTHQRHGDKRWLRYTSYAFAAQETVVPLVAAELPKAALTLPIAFMAQGETFLPVAVMGLAPGQNLLVAPDGRWLGAYIPAAFRGHPFGFARTPEGQEILCVDEQSGLITEGASGEAFFATETELSTELASVLEFLGQTRANALVTQGISALLARHGLIQPWPILLRGGAAEQNLEGLYRIDEAAFNALPDAAVLELRAAGALPVIYCQLLSMQHLPLLGRLAEARARAAVQSGDSATDLDLLTQDVALQFD